MKLSEDVHPMLDRKNLALLAQYNIRYYVIKTVSVVKQLIANLRSISALLSAKSERVAAMLMISYTAASSLRFGYYHMLYIGCICLFTIIQT